MLHTIYQGYWSCGFLQDYFTFCPKAYVKRVNPRAGPFLAQSILDRGSLGDAT